MFRKLTGRLVTLTTDLPEDFAGRVVRADRRWVTLDDARIFDDAHRNGLSIEGVVHVRVDRILWAQVLPEPSATAAIAGESEAG